MEYEENTLKTLMVDCDQIIEINVTGEIEIVCLQDYEADLMSM